MKDANLLRAFQGTPWAILESKLVQVRAVIERHASGQRLTPEQIEAVVGPQAAARPTSRRAGAVGVIPVYGVIAQRMNMMSEMSGGTSTEALTQDLRRLAADPNVKAIVLDVDSPGGSVFGVPELAAEIRGARQQKHVVAVANSIAASAAYWLASQADELVVTPSGQVGSIGVFMEHDDMSAAMENDGVKVTLISAGKFKTEANPFEPLSEDAKAAIQAMVDDYYVQFVGDVAAGRSNGKTKYTRADVRGGFGQGRMVMADAALKQGMVDRIATLDEVLQGLGVGNATNKTSLAAEQHAGAIAAQRRREVSALLLAHNH
jgi:signal peptide peptidase SppA